MPRLTQPLLGSLATIAAVSALALGCGEKNTSTTPTPASGGAVDWTVSGTLVANPDGQPIAGASITATGSSPVASNATGQFSISGAGTQPVGVRVTIAAMGYVRRDTSIQAGSNRSGLVIDLIRDSAPFSLTLYRELVRGSLDGAVRTTRRWHQDPNFYIQTVDENGADVPKFFIDSATSVITDIVSDATAGRYRADRVETGTSTAPAGPGTIRIWFPAASIGAAGIASGVGVNPCTVRVWQGDVPSAVTKVIAHEIGHCLGLSHITVTGLPPTPQGLMGKSGWGTLAAPRLTDAERFHAAILYSRPDGNADLDVDPASWLFSVIR
jgi:hypothetical protein